MPRRSEKINAFNAGEISPELQGRTDLEKYGEGAKTIENFIVRPEGGIHRRTGTRFVAEAYDSDVKSRLIPFIFSEDQAYILEYSYSDTWSEGRARVFADESIVETALRNFGRADCNLNTNQWRCSLAFFSTLRTA